MDKLRREYWKGYKQALRDIKEEVKACKEIIDDRYIFSILDTVYEDRIDKHDT